MFSFNPETYSSLYFTMPIVIVSWSIIGVYTYREISKDTGTLPVADKCKELYAKRSKALYFFMIILIIFSVRQLNPLRMSDNAIRNGLLRRTTSGMTVDDVTRVINRRLILLPQVNSSRSIPLTSFPFSGEVLLSSPSNIIYRNEIRVGYIIHARLRYSYFLVFRMNVSIAWIFDMEENLIDINVQRGLSI